MSGVAVDAVELTEGLVGARRGELLRRCAVPHQFDEALLAELGGLGADEAGTCFEQFAELSVIEINDDSLSVHGRWREPLWRWWLQPPQRAALAEISERLVAWFTVPADPSGEDPAARRRMFHLIGCRHDEGLRTFDALFRTARHRRRFSECSLLLRLVREYDPLLAPEEKALLDYHEAKLAIDVRRYETALPLLQAVAANDAAGAVLRLNATVRAGHALRKLDREEEALALLEAARDGAKRDPATARSHWRVQYELGELYRDLGRIDDAAETLSLAIASVTENDDADVAGMLSSLGTVQLRNRDADAAITSFQASLRHLQAQGDAMRPATVLHNLGLAQADGTDWTAAEASFSASLALKREAGDQAGQAMTLLQLSRALVATGRRAQARDAASQSAALYESLGDPAGATKARQAIQRMQGEDTPAPPPRPAPPEATKRRVPVWLWIVLVLGCFALLAWLGS